VTKDSPLLSGDKLALLEMLLMEEGLAAEAPQPKPVRPPGAVLPLSFSQERMWFMQQMQPDSGAYNVSIGARMKGELNLAVLEQALNDVVQRHEILRTRYEKVDGHPLPVIEETAVINLALFDFQHLPLASRETELSQAMVDFVKRPFDLVNGPIMRAGVFRYSPHDHVSAVVAHHIATDAWSSFILVQEIAALYQSYNENKPVQMDPLPLQYFDFAIWQRDHFQGAVLEEQLGYWRKKLAGVPVLEMPADRPRPAIQTFNGNVVEHNLSPQLLQKLHQLSKEQKVTPFMTMLTALEVLLYRYTRQEDFAVGVPIANRQLASTENLIGTFVNMLVLRADMTGEPTFLELLQRVQAATLEAYAHQDMPFEKLVAEMQLDRDMSHSPLFQIMLDYINVPSPKISMAGLEGDNVGVNRHSSKFDMGLIVVDTAQLQSLELEYNTDLFDEATAVRFLDNLETLLEAIVANPHTPIAELPVLAAAERQLVLESWNDTAVPYPHEKCLHQLIEAQAERTPGKTAVISQNKTITYQALNQRAEQMAHDLRQLGVGPDVIVGIFLERSIDMVVSLLAVLKAGGAYLPLDPAYPLDRLSYMLADAQSPVLITESSLNLTEALTKDLPQAIHVYLVDEPPQNGRYHSNNGSARTATSQNLAYVIYTSGSTGKPKGVQIPHQAVVNFLLSMQREPGLTAEDHLLSVTTLSFDIAVLELYLPLITGATVTLVPRTVAYDGHQLAQTIAHSGATVIQATPVTWRMLLDAGWAGEPELKILCGGEAMPPELARDLLPRCRELWNMYGPTETTVWSTTRQITSGTDPITIGHPIANTQIYILDKNKQPVPIGVVGDLYIGGHGLARNYRHRPELTAEKFIDDPFRPGNRMYSTGDLARYLANGEVDFLGRSDFQIKIRGFRVELGEIESALVAHTAVREVVTIVREDRPGDKRLVAYLILHEGMDQPDQSALRDFVGGKLPAYMVPAAFVFLESFPKTPNRKVDRKALPEPEQTVNREDRNFVEARTKLEAILMRIWENVLNVHPISVHDNFFRIGGHSLVAVRAFAQIEKEMGLQLPLTVLFQAPTIAELAQVIQSEGWTSNWTSLVPIQAKGSRPPFFYVSPFLISVLSLSQLGHDLGEDQPLYGLQPQGMDGDHPIHQSVKEMASHYIDEMRSLKPQGPYLLGGHCAGSWVAFEMAQQLQRQGEQVELLVLVDSEPPNIVPPKINRLQYVASRLAYFWRDGRLWPAISWQWSLLYQRLITYYFGQENNRRVAAVRKAHADAHRVYQSGIFEGEAVFIRSSESVAMKDKDWHECWSELITGELDIEVAEGTHAGLLVEPTVDALAQKIRAAIDEVIDGRSVPALIPQMDAILFEEL
jgi:amino acid adenylation domain-containing protein